MKSAILILAALCVMAATAHAQNVNSSISRLDAVFDVQPDGSMKQTNTFYFSHPLNESVINYTLSNGLISNIEVFDQSERLNYQLTNNNNSYDIVISLKGQTNLISIIYTTQDSVFRGESANQFFTELNFESPVQNVTATLKLPEGFGIYQNDFTPGNAQIASDGKRIMLVWNLSNVQDVVFSTKFSSLSRGANIFTIFAVVVLGALAYVYVHFTKRTKEAFMKGFREDEQKTIRLLEQRKMILQRDLQAEFKFSRAKSTRIVSILQKEGLVRKQKYGNTNRIFWIKDEAHGLGALIGRLRKNGQAVN